MIESIAEARYGTVRTIRMIRRRRPLTLSAVNGAIQPKCQAPVGRESDPQLPAKACRARAWYCYRIERLIVPFCWTHAMAMMNAREVHFVDATAGICRVCGCTQMDCSGCVERTGEPCSWVAADLCSACAASDEND